MAASRFNVIAEAVIGKTIIIGRNSKRNNQQFKRNYKNGQSYTAHAETDLIMRCIAKTGKIPKKIKVIRLLADGSLNIAKPCIYCEKFLKNAGVKTVQYSNEKGELVTMKL